MDLDVPERPSPFIILYGNIFDIEYTVNNNMRVDRGAAVITVDGIACTTHWGFTW